MEARLYCLANANPRLSPSMSGSPQDLAARLQHSVSTVIVGKEEQVRRCLLALLCRGHLLIEDVPGVGKTMLAKALARSLGCSYERVQFTPDLLPGDVTGVSVFNPQSASFEFRPGPVFTQVLLADEINRATPKTQSALLEAMEERQVTVDGVTHPLPDPFIVIATQNPIELGGTFPLPEAQVDRFLFRISIGYLSTEDEAAVLDRFQTGSPLDTQTVVASPDEIREAQRLCGEVYCDPVLKQYCVRLVQRTREHPDVALGASPRGSLGLLHASQALAAISGRNYVLPDDIKQVAEPVLAHRVTLKPNAELRGLTSAYVIEAVLDSEPVPEQKQRLA